MKVVLKFLTALGLLLITNAFAQTNWESLYQRNVDSIPIIFNRGGICSGALISERLIITAYHCVPYMRPISVGWKDDSTNLMPARLVAANPLYDLAMIELREPSLRKPLALLTDVQSLKEGQPVSTIGHPMSIGSDWVGGLRKNHTFVISSGIVSRIDEERVITDMALNPGNSGGPVFNLSGTVVGFVTAKLVALEVDNIGYLIPIKVAQELLDQYKNELADKKRSLPLPKSTFFMDGVIFQDNTLSDYNMRQLGFGFELGVSVFDRIHISWIKNFKSEPKSKLENLNQISFGYQFVFEPDPLFNFSITPAYSRKFISIRNDSDTIQNIASLKLYVSGFSLTYEREIESDGKDGYYIGLRFISF